LRRSCRSASRQAAAFDNPDAITSLSLKTCQVPSVACCTLIVIENLDFGFAGLGISGGWFGLVYVVGVI
jgi:hypothetical protein